MNTKDTYIAWLLVALALCAWGAVGFFWWSIQGEERQRVADIQNAQQSSTIQSASVRTHSIVQDTAPERAQLDKVLSVDVVSAAALLRDVGRATHVDVKLSGALPETAPPAESRSPQVQAVGFALQANGTFSALMRTMQLLETLPLGSSVERFDIQHTQNAEGASSKLWHMSMYIRVLTTANVSS